jgi:hypothetical protein
VIVNGRVGVSVHRSDGVETLTHHSDTPTLRHTNTILPYLRPIFVEQQRFRQWWLWVTVIGVCAIELTAFAILYFKSRRFEAMIPLVVGTIPIALLILNYSTRLVVRVDVDGLHVRFWPFSRLDLPHRRIVSIAVEDYDPIGEFGGWGVKGPPARWGWCYTVNGRRGVRIELDNRHRLLIGSQRADELAEAMRSAGGRA